MKKFSKPRVGIFSITSCAGCQLRVLFIKDAIPDMFDRMDVVNFQLIKEFNEDGPFDISFIEGAVTRKDEMDYVRGIRDKSKVVVALGTCATYGGVPSIRDLGYIDEEEIKRRVYEELTHLESVEEVYGVGRYIKVDYYLRGCPLIKEEFVKLLKDLLLGKIPNQGESPVCVECRAKGNLCLLQQGKPCIGPATYGGCNALCTSIGIPCYGCRGPLPDANIDALIDLLLKQGISREDINKRFTIFAGTSKKFLELKPKKRK